jgi:hypothetical protein
LVVVAGGGGASPDPSGYYVFYGTYGGQRAYKRIDSAYYIWYDGGPWILSTLEGSQSPGAFGHYGLTGTYTTSGTYSGSVIVSINT